MLPLPSEKMGELLSGRADGGGITSSICDTETEAHFFEGFTPLAWCLLLPTIALFKPLLLLLLLLLPPGGRGKSGG